MEKKHIKLLFNSNVARRQANGHTAQSPLKLSMDDGQELLRLGPVCHWAQTQTTGLGLEQAGVA